MLRAVISSAIIMACAPVSAAPAEPATKVRKVSCSNLNLVAREGISYSLLGAWEPFTTHACFKNEKFKYFMPEAAEPEGEILNTSKYKWFDKKKDKYKVLKIESEGEVYKVGVEFTIDGKKFETVYTYSPKPLYAEKTGVCGFITNHEIKLVRKDCVDMAKWKKIEERLKKTSKGV